MKGTKLASTQTAARKAAGSITVLGEHQENNNLNRSSVGTRGEGMPKKLSKAKGKDNKGRKDRREDNERGVHRPTCRNPNSTSTEVISCYTGKDNRVNMYKLDNDQYLNYKPKYRNKKEQSRILKLRQNRKAASEIAFLSGSHGEWTTTDDVVLRVINSSTPRGGVHGVDLLVTLQNGWMMRTTIDHLSIIVSPSGLVIIGYDLTQRMEHDVIIRSVPTNHEVTPSLNGINGEATNSDDMNYAQARRRARNHRFQRPVNGGRNPQWHVGQGPNVVANAHIANAAAGQPNGPMPVAMQVAPIGNANAVALPLIFPIPPNPPPPPPPPVPSKEYGVFQGDWCAFKNKIYHEDDEPHAADEIRYTIAGEDLSCIRRISDFCYEVSDDPNLNVLSYRVPLLYVEWYHAAKTGEKFTGLAIIPWLIDAKNKYNIAVMNDGVHRMAEGYIRKGELKPHGLQIEMLVKDTVSKICFDWQNRQQEVGERGHLGECSVYETTLLNDWSRHTMVAGQIDSERMIRENGVLLEDRNGLTYIDYLPRTDVEIRVKRGTMRYLPPGVVNPANFIEVDGPVVLPRGSRPVGRLLGRDVKWYNTYFMRFIGENAVPKVYDKCEHNAFEALKRVIGQKDFYDPAGAGRGEGVFNLLGNQLAVNLYAKYRCQKGIWGGAPIGNDCYVRGHWIFDLRNRIAHYDPAYNGFDVNPFDWTPTIDVMNRYWRVNNGDTAYVRLTRFQNMLFEHWGDKLFWQSKQFIGRTRTFISNAIGHMSGLAGVTIEQVQASFISMYNIEQARELMKEVPHIKRRLRRLYAAGYQWKPVDWIGLVNTTLQLKRETCKFGKAPRLFAAYLEACMMANELPEFVKEFLDGYTDFKTPNGMDASIHVFAKRKPLDIQEDFRRISTLRPSEIVIMLYSDDSVVALYVNGVPRMYNVDISSCDSSQRDAIFHLVYKMMKCYNPLSAANLVE